jgi:hypothetical protein
MTDAEGIYPPGIRQRSDFSLEPETSASTDSATSALDFSRLRLSENPVAK